MPFVMFLLYAAIMSIEPRSSRRRRSTAPTRWQEFRHLTLPGILPVLAVTAAFRAVDAFTKAFDIILATTAGGPGQATMVFRSTSGALRSSACVSARPRRSP